MLTTRKYINNLVACWIGCMLLPCCSPNSCSPNQGAGPQGNTPTNNAASPDNSLTPYAIRFMDSATPIQSYSALIHHFDQALANKKGQQAIVAFTRKIAVLADANGLNHDGFDWRIEEVDGAMKVCMKGTPSNKTGYLDQAYNKGNGQHCFGKYIAEAKKKGEQAAIFRTPFRGSSSPGRILAIPTGEYLTVYHFSKDATEEAIIAFWRNTITSVKNFGSEKVERISIHTGVNYLQTVAHFHLRIRIKQQYHNELKTQYACNLPDT